MSGLAADAGENGRLQARVDDGASIYSGIREAILIGHYSPGERLIESRLAAEFGVSRTQIREAMTQLEAEHLLSHAPKRGLVVRPLSSRDIEEIYELRILLESHAAAVACKNITTGELDHLRILRDEMREVIRAATDSDDGRLERVRTISEMNNQFHLLIQRAARNCRLESMLRTIVDVPLVFRSFYWYSGRELVESQVQHDELLRALEEHDGVRAEALMKQHISRGLNTLLREMLRS